MTVQWKQIKSGKIGINRREIVRGEIDNGRE